jgi:hypothetical protein
MVIDMTGLFFLNRSCLPSREIVDTAKTNSSDGS